jgi:nitrite reductase/ring-hydroxylating ferredoxin subunit
VGWHIVAKSVELENGSVIGLEHNGTELALFRIDDKVYATSNHNRSRADHPTRPGS